MNKYLAAFLFCLCSGHAFAQETITAENLIGNVRYLASDSLEGRLPGTKGNKLAADYIRDVFRKNGLQHVYKNYTQPFPLTLKLDALPTSKNYLQLASATDAVLNKEYSIYPFSGSGVVNARVACAVSNDVLWQHTAEIKGCWWLLHRQKAKVPSTDSLSDYMLATKAMQLGAGGVLFICPDSLDEKDVLIRLRPRKDSTLQIPVLQVKRTIWTILQQNLAAPGYKPDGMGITGRTLKASVNIIPEKITAENIVGVIPGSDRTLKNEYIILGAHYDHLGYGGYGSGSLKPDTTAIHNGADDNASGTSCLLELAKALMLHKDSLKRSIILVAFSGEEEGLMGSSWFADHLPVPRSAVKIMLNMDMMGSVNEHNNLYMGGAGTFPGGVDFMKKMGDGSPLALVVNAGGVGGSDHVSFYKKDIPSVGFHTGGTSVYHTPEDDATLINAKGLEEVSRYVFHVIMGLSQRNGSWDFIKQD
ncbi:M28 family metallopeptidase [Chitinophagaceae bacterium MMS25-I14]